MVTHEFVCNDLDISALKQEVLSHYEEFDKIHYRRTATNSPHAEMTDIWVRYNDISGLKDTADLKYLSDEHDSVWYPVIEKIPAVKKVVFDLMFKVEGERIGGVLITKLPPGGHIARHTDSGWHAQYYDKFFVPLQIGEGAIFGFEDGDIHSKEGEAWWFDNSNPHWVTNNSNCDRIAMIVCIRTEKYKDKNAHRI
jgi:quercetin dioxygenase-like cupin family protein